MRLLRTIKEVRDFRIGCQSLGLVPTMGALHNGHKSLMQESLANNSHTLVSIFVNPTQFAPNEDFDTYPRDLQKDLEFCENLGISAIFAPNIEEIYPLDSHSLSARDETTLNPPRTIGYILEGFSRPSHFAGVLQVVLKLFNLTNPTRAYFGKKDAQQVLLIQKMVRDLFLPIEIVPCEIVRDVDGLALSSRNVYLSPKERESALCIPKCINLIASQIQNDIKNVATLESMARECLCKVELEYASFYSRTLKPIQEVQKTKSIFLIAAKVGKTRLIDNLWC